MIHYLDLKNYQTFKLTGADVESFLSGQVTSEIKMLAENAAVQSARLNVKGLVQAFFFIAKAKDNYFIICHQSFSSNLVENLNKYIIMEDVEISPMSETAIFIYGPGFSEFVEKQKIYFKTIYIGRPGSLVFKQDYSNLDNCQEEDLKENMALAGETNPSDFEIDKELINNLTLNETAISYSKGCFLGQEPVAKIQSNRGASYYPMALRVDEKRDWAKGEKIFLDDRKVGEVISSNNINGEFIISAKLLRDVRVEDRQYEFKIAGDSVRAQVKTFPLVGSYNLEEIIAKDYDLALKLYNLENDTTDSVATLKDIFFLDSTNKDVCESLGAILGNLKQYKEAIHYMNRLEELEPDYGMANTNKSVYFMKLGQIEEAEKEKEVATVKSFKHFGKEADKAEAEKKQLEQQLADRERRKNMFTQVLQLDELDTVANYGLSDIYFAEEKYEQALAHVDKVVENDKKYSVAYLLKGKIHEKQKDTDSAKRIYEVGIEVASKNGDMQPANEMQYRLNQLTQS